MASQQPNGKLLTPDTPQKRTKSKTGGRTPSKSRSAVRGSPSRAPSTVPPGSKRTPTKQKKDKKNKALGNNVEIQPPEPVDIIIVDNEEEEEVVIQIEEPAINPEEQIEIVSKCDELTNFNFAEHIFFLNIIRPLTWHKIIKKHKIMKFPEISKKIKQMTRKGIKDI